MPKIEQQLMPLKDLITSPLPIESEQRKNIWHMLRSLGKAMNIMEPSASAPNNRKDEHDKITNMVEQLLKEVGGWKNQMIVPVEPNDSMPSASAVRAVFQGTGKIRVSGGTLATAVKRSTKTLKSLRKAPWLIPH